MKEARYFYVPQADEVNQLPQEEATHALRVLRLQPGDEIFLIDGAGVFHLARVTVTSSKQCLYEVVKSMPQSRAWKGRIHLAIAPTKMMDRVEWMVEKATEVGFDELTFLDCRFSERRVVKTERVEKIVVAAMKQSRKPWKPVVNGMTPFAQFVSTPRDGLKFIAHCYEEVPRMDLFDILTQPLSSTTDTDVTVMIGPEGDFSIDEVRLAMEHGFVPVSLGTSRLRTETAGLSAVMMVQLTLRKR